jgi:murein DD-endopeptidase MepM/ murein hydrolase activator NlpD
MKRSIASLSVLTLLVFALSCQKDQSQNTQEKQQEQVQDEEPVNDPIPDNTQETEAAAAAAAKVASPVPGYKVTYPYGIKNPRYAAGYHTGDDYAAPTGAKVVAVRAGTIVWSNNNGGAYGRWIGLRADNGRDYVYCHLSVRSVSTGTKVVAGQKIGEVGATGNVTGPHLHFEDRPKGGGYGQVRKPTW